MMAIAAWEAASSSAAIQSQHEKPHPRSTDCLSGCLSGSFLGCGSGSPWAYRSNAGPSLHARPDSTLSRRSEEHTSELQSRGHLVCRLLLEKKKKKKRTTQNTSIQ